MSNYITSNLSKSPDFYEETIDLIQKSFRYDSENSFSKDFWPLMNPHNHKRCHIVIDKDKNKVICHIGFCFRDIRVAGQKFPIALIGAIATDENYQGQGIFKRLFNELIEQYIKDVSFFLLWSEKDEMYSKFNFFEFGSVIQTGVEDLNITEIEQIGFSKTKLANLSPQDLTQIKVLYSHNYNKYISLNRRSKDWDQLCYITSSDLYIKRNDKNIITHYFFANKGFDLSNVIHEISFYNDEELIEKLSKFKLWLPEKHQSYIKHALCLYTGLIKLGNPEKFTRFITQVYSNELYINNITDNVVQFEFQQETYTLPINDFINMTLGPKPAKEFIRYAPWFSISGLDSI